MAIQLTISENGDPKSRYVRSFLQDRIVIGRARSSDVCLPDMAVSTRHAEIRVSENDYVLVDLDSLNGTRLADTALTAFRPKRLSNGDRVSIANFTLEFRLGAGAGREEARDTSVRHAREMLANVLVRAGAPQNARSLVVVSGPHRASRFDLPREGTLVIGRAKDADIILDDRDVWKQHAEVVVTEERVTVRDLCASHGLKVAGETVKSATLSAGDQFTVGRTSIALEHPAERSLGVIFDAPEEDTSSIAIAPGPMEVSEPTSEPLPAASKPAPASVASDPPPEPEPEQPEEPPVGPADPLISETEPPESATLPRLSAGTGDKSDIGLILVGAVIILAAVAALVYLYS